MTDHIRDLLDSASDDGDRPLGFTPASISARGRLARRRRSALTGFAAVGTAAAVVGAIAFAGSLGGTEQRGVSPQGEGTDATVATPAPTDTPLGAEEQEIVRRCAAAADVVPSTMTGGGQWIDGEPVLPAPIADWEIDVHLTDRLGTTATFVSPDLTKWAVCDLFDTGTEFVEDTDTVSEARPLRTGPVTDEWRGPEGFRHQDAHPGWAQVCTSPEGKVCARELFHAAFPLREGVVDIRVEAPDGTDVRPLVGEHTWVMRHAEDRVDANRSPDDMQPLPSMPVTFVDAQGQRIIRYDLNPTYKIPEHCLDNEAGC